MPTLSEQVGAALLRCLLATLSLTYGASLTAVSSLLRCVDVGGALYLFVDAEVACYTSWQRALFVALAALAAYPAFVAVAAWRLSHAEYGSLSLAGAWRRGGCGRSGPGRSGARAHIKSRHPVADSAPTAAGASRPRPPQGA